MAISRLADRTRKRYGLALVLALVSVTAVAGWLASRTEFVETNEASASEVSWAVPRDARISFAVYGDSISQADSLAFSNLDVGRGSWAYYVDTSRVVMTGGWVRGGGTVTELLTTAPEDHAQVYVVFLGTNDLKRPNVAFEKYAADLQSLYERVGPARPKSFLVVGTGPKTKGPSPRAAMMNERTAALAAAKGWSYVDPWTDLVGPGNTWAQPQYTTDGLHPSAEGAKLLAPVMTAAILAAAG